LRLKILKKLRTASLNSEFTGFYKKKVSAEGMEFESTSDASSIHSHGHLLV